MSLEPGTQAPAIEAQDQGGQTVKLDLGKPTVLYFYPKDDTPGCTKEACAFRDDLAAFEARGVQVVGVSTDTVESHKAFADKHALTFPLLADADQEVAAAYGVLGESGHAQRITFIIEDGTVRKVFEHVNPTGHSEQVLKALEAS